MIYVYWFLLHVLGLHLYQVEGALPDDDELDFHFDQTIRNRVREHPLTRARLRRERRLRQQRFRISPILGEQGTFWPPWMRSFIRTGRLNNEVRYLLMLFDSRYVTPEGREWWRRNGYDGPFPIEHPDFDTDGGIADVLNRLGIDVGQLTRSLPPGEPPGPLVQERIDRLYNEAVSRMADVIDLAIADMHDHARGVHGAVCAAMCGMTEEEAAPLLSEREETLLLFTAIRSFMLATGGVQRVSPALMEHVISPPASIRGAFHQVYGRPPIRTLLTGYGRNAAREVFHILNEGIAANVNAPHLARRIQPYVKGSEPFQKAFGGTDMRRITDPALRDAARRMSYNARRIAFTSIHDSRVEAEIQHFAADPLIEAVQWTLSDFRGSARIPDECDSLAYSNMFGLGSGVFPIAQTPASPHPFCRCERFPVVRPYSRAGQPKPNPLVDMSAIAIPPQFDVSPARVAAVTARVDRAITEFTRRGPVDDILRSYTPPQP